MLIKKFYQGGGKGKLYVYDDQKYSRKRVEWKIYKMEDLDSIVTHFELYPLIDHKLKKYSLWKELLLLIDKKFYLNPEGLIKIQNLTSALTQRHVEARDEKLKEI